MLGESLSGEWLQTLYLRDTRMHCLHTPNLHMAPRHSTAGYSRMSYHNRRPKRRLHLPIRQPHTPQSPSRLRDIRKRHGPRDIGLIQGFAATRTGSASCNGSSCRRRARVTAVGRLRGTPQAASQVRVTRWARRCACTRYTFSGLNALSRNVQVHESLVGCDHAMDRHGSGPGMASRGRVATRRCVLLSIGLLRALHTTTLSVPYTTTLLIQKPYNCEKKSMHRHVLTTIDRYNRQPRQKT